MSFETKKAEMKARVNANLAKQQAKDTKKKAKAVVKKPLESKSLQSAGRKSAFAEDSKIIVLAKENPKREGSVAHKKFKLYAKSKTVGDFIKAGGTTNDLHWDAEHGFIKVN